MPKPLNVLRGNKMDIFSLPLILLYSALFGLTMKIADLFDEHKMRWFKGDALLFGFLWGIFGILLVLSRADVANVTLAMILAFVVRMRIDYRDHAIATVMIIIAFIWKSTFDLAIFPIFFLTFLIFGWLRDYLGDVRKKKDWLYKINEPAWYYIISPLIYGIFSNNWVIFFVFAVYVIFYYCAKYSLYHMKKYSKL